MIRLALALLLTSCASGPLRDSHQYRFCKAACDKEGASSASVVEDEDSVLCLCKKTPEAI